MLDKGRIIRANRRLEKKVGLSWPSLGALTGWGFWFLWKWGLFFSLSSFIGTILVIPYRIMLRMYAKLVK